MIMKKTAEAHLSANKQQNLIENKAVERLLKMLSGFTKHSQRHSFSALG